MNSFWRIIATALCVAVLCGSAIIWHKSQRDNERKNAKEVSTFHRLAEQGDSKAQYKLGLLYYQGNGVPQDYTEAVHWYQKAADQGESMSQYAIGYMYETGKGVKQDFAEAALWYHKSADQDDPQAQCALGSLYYEGRGMQQDRSEAARWYRKAADQGFSKAQYDLGYMYANGQGVPQDRAIANYWYLKAADQGNMDARQTLGVGITTWRLFILLGLLIGGSLLTAGLLIPGKVRWSIQTKRTTIAGVLCFVSAGLNWYGYTHYQAKCLVCGSGAFSLLTWTLDGILIILLIIVVREGIKTSEWMRLG